MNPRKRSEHKPVFHSTETVCRTRDFLSKRIGHFPLLFSSLISASDPRFHQIQNNMYSSTPSTDLKWKCKGRGTRGQQIGRPELWHWDARHACRSWGNLAILPTGNRGPALCGPREPGLASPSLSTSSLLMKLMLLPGRRKSETNIERSQS